VKTSEIEAIPGDTHPMAWESDRRACTNSVGMGPVCTKTALPTQTRTPDEVRVAYILLTFSVHDRRDFLGYRLPPV
jgi:hypothetical protein